MSKGKALVADDQESLRSLIELTVSELGYEVHAEPDGAGARRWLEAHTPELIVLDIMMPGVNGLDLCRWARAEPRLARVPILISSALRDEETTQDALELGAVDFLLKPFGPEALREKIARIRPGA